MFKKIFSPNSIPIIFILVGVFSILLSIWGSFENNLWKETWGTFGKTILASGVFAGILKLMQISGVFKEELEKLIFEPKYLKNRKDIPVYWEKLSQELFKNKFPNISKKILNDIKDLYLPTQDVIYYDEPEHFLEIKLDEDDFITMKHNTSLTIVCTGEKECISYEFANSMNFKEVKEEVSYTTSFIKVNGKKIENFKHEQIVDGNSITNKFKINLEGDSKYEIEREEIKKYSLKNDDIMYFRAAKLTNSLKVNVNHSANLNVYFRKMGELDDFIIKQNSATFKKYEYKGIIYKEQGYFIQFKKLEQ